MLKDIINILYDLKDEYKYSIYDNEDNIYNTGKYIDSVYISIFKKNENCENCESELDLKECNICAADYILIRLSDHYHKRWIWHYHYSYDIIELPKIMTKEEYLEDGNKAIFYDRYVVLETQKLKRELIKRFKYVLEKNKLLKNT